MATIYQELLTSVFKKPSQLSRLLVSAWSVYRSGPIASALPVRLELEQGTACNLHCQMCPRSHIKRPKGLLTFDKFRKIYDQIKPPFLNLTGLGESFINPDIFKIVSYAKKHGSYVKFDTNGILANKTIAKKTIKSGLDLLSFSIDAADRKTYKKIRGADKFDLVINNLKFFIKMRNLQKSSLKIHTCTVVQKDNLNQLIPLIKMLSQIGVDRINAIYIVENGVIKNKESRTNKYRQQLKKIINEYYKIKDVLKTEVDITPVEEYAHQKDGNSAEAACFLPWHSAYITWNGDVFPCCFYYDGQIKLGNVFKQDFNKIWNNSINQNFRRNLIYNRKKLPICDRCEVNEIYISNKISLLKKVPLLKLLSERL